MVYSSEPSKVLVLSPDSSASILIIWLAVLSDASTPSSVVPNDMKSATIGSAASDAAAEPIVMDFFSFGFTDDGVQSSERVSSQIIRIEAEESGDNTSTFEGSLEYTMINQLNALDEGTYLGLSTIASDPSFIVIEDLTD